jgi:hypothetical protein
MRRFRRITDGVLVLFVALIVFAAAAQLHHNEVAAAHGHGPRDHPVATPGIADR